MDNRQFSRDDVYVAVAGNMFPLNGLSITAIDVERYPCERRHQYFILGFEKMPPVGPGARRPGLHSGVGTCGLQWVPG